MRFDLLHFGNIASSNEVKSDTLSAPSATSTDSVEVCVNTFGDIKVNHNAYLLDVDATRSYVG